MSTDYHIISKKDSSELAKLLAENGQVLLPMVELIEESRMAVDELIETLDRATVEAVLWISAASSLIAAEKNFRRVMGYRDLWMLKRRSETILTIPRRRHRIQESHRQLSTTAGTSSLLCCCSLSPH